MAFLVVPVSVGSFSKSIGTPEPSIQFIQKALLDENVQYFLLSLYVSHQSSRRRPSRAPNAPADTDDVGLA